MQPRDEVTCNLTVVHFSILGLEGQSANILDGWVVRRFKYGVVVNSFDLLARVTEKAHQDIVNEYGPK